MTSRDRRPVLVPLDRSRRSEVVLSGLRGVCGRDDEIVLLSVAAPDVPRKKYSMGPSDTLTEQPGSVVAGLAPGFGLTYQVTTRPVFETRHEVRERQLAELTTYLEKQADKLRGKGYRVRSEALIDKRAAGAILRYARDIQPRLIVMVRRSRDPRRFLFGSVSSAVIKADVAPVLLLPARTGRAQE